MSDYVRQARERWFDGMPGARHALHFDAQTQHQIHWMDSILALADMAMDDEGIPQATRQRVIRAVIYGSPNPADAELRMIEREKQVAQLAEQPPSIRALFRR